MEKIIHAINIRRIVICAGCTILSALVMCMGAALLIENGSLPVAWGANAARASLLASVVMCGVLIIGRRGEGTLLEIAINGTIILTLLLIAMIVIFPDAQIEFTATPLVVLLGSFFTWLLLCTPKKNKRISRKTHRKRK